VTEGLNCLFNNRSNRLDRHEIGLYRQEPAAELLHGGPDLFRRSPVVHDGDIGPGFGETDCEAFTQTVAEPVTIAVFPSRLNLSRTICAPYLRASMGI
jgi:hypothetical protein